MADLDLSKYEGAENGCALGVIQSHCPRCRVKRDAPLLLAEVRRLREENEQQRKTIERYAQWDAQRQRNVDLAAQLAALRQSHARLLAEIGRLLAQQDKLAFKSWQVALRRLQRVLDRERAVAEAEALL